MTTRIRLLGPLSVFCLFALEGRLDAQLSISFSGAAAQVQSTALVEGVAEQIGGFWVGGAVEFGIGPLAVRARSLAGSMTPVGDSRAFDRDGGEVEGSIALRPLSWVSVGTSFTYRAFDSPVGFQKWTLPAVGLTVMPKLGDPALRAFVHGSYLTSVSVSGREAPTMGLWAEGGLVADPRRLPITVRISYRFERYDFPTSTMTRVEQFDRLALEFGVRLGSSRR